MLAIAITLLIIGFYFIYNTSKRALLRTDRLSLYLQNHPRLSKLTGLSFGYLSIRLLITLYGSLAGTCYFIILLTTISSLIIILSPLLKVQK